MRAENKAQKDAPAGKAWGREARVLPSPRLYLALVGAWCVIFAVLAAVLYFVFAAGNPALSSFRPVIFMIVFLPAALGGLFIGVELLSLRFEKDFLPWIPLSKKGAIFRAFLPLCKGLGGLFGWSGEAVSSSLISLVNRMTRDALKKIGGRGALVLLPRCVQNAECVQRIAEDISNCRACGNCDVSFVVRLREKYRFRVEVVAGGELARKKVHEISPDLVVAVACENELVEGLGGVAAVPVIGIPNLRPEGPCVNTLIDCAELENVVRLYLGE